MENKDIEKLLKESANEVKIKDFSERWEKIKERIDSAQEVELKETTSETVLATSSNTSVSQNSVRNKFIVSVCAVFLIIGICLAIVLPLTLKHNDKIYFSLHELTPVTVTENEFYDNLDKTDLKIFNLEKFEVNSYALLYTQDNILVGGRFDITDEEEGVLVSLTFYNSSVTSEFKADKDYNLYNVNGFKIDYKTKLNDNGLYLTTAKAVGKNISYELKCLSGEENIETFFQKFFG